MDALQLFRRSQSAPTPPEEPLLTWEDALQGITWTQMKRLATREPIPADLRAVIWVEFLNIKHYMKKYKPATLKVLNKHQDYRTISHDVPRTLHSQFENRKEFEQDLTQALKMFVTMFSEFGYVQGMNEVAGFLLYILKDVDLCFLGMCSLYDKYNLQLVWDIQMLIDIVHPAIEKRISSKCKRIHSKMEELDIRLSDFCPKLVIPLFLQTNMSIESRLVIVDWLLIGGIKVFRNLIVGMMRMKQRNLLSASTNTAFLTILFKMDTEVHEVAKFVEIFEGCKNRHVGSKLILSSPI